MHGIILKQIPKYEMIFRSNAAYNQLHYFLKLSVTAELERADFNSWNSSVPLFIFWIYKQKVERSKTIATGKKKDRETQGHQKTFTEEDKQEQNRKPNSRKRKTK